MSGTPDLESQAICQKKINQAPDCIHCLWTHAGASEPSVAAALQAAAPAGSKADGSRPPAHSFFVAAVDGDGDEDKELVVALAAWCESLAAPDGLVILDFGANADARASLADGSPPASAFACRIFR